MLSRQAVATGALVGALTLAVAGCGGADPEPAGPQLPRQEFEPAVPEGFFGINGQGLRPLAENGQLDVLEAQLAQVEAGGIDFVRANTDWPRIEPTPPSGEQHAYDLTGLDAFMGALADHGIAWEPAVMGIPTPQWAVDPTAAKVCGLRSPPARVEDLAALAGALAERYGRNGTFWEENPDAEYVPVTRYEIWNEPNLASFWCPVPDPSAYAALADATADAIRAVDPRATLILGGLAGFETTVIDAPGQGHYSSAEFLERMLAERPALARKIDVIGVHAYGPDPAEVLRSLAYQRSAIRQAGLGDKPMSLNETGWFTAGAGGPMAPVDEETRAPYLGEVTDAVTRSRTSCGIDSFAPHTWVTAELNLGTVEDWYGIADPQSGEPYSTGLAYIDEVLSFEGRGEEPPPRAAENLCGR
jgi:hypothetical protein